MPHHRLIPNPYSRSFCVPNEVFYKSSQYKWHSPNDFTEISGHKMKIMPYYVQEVQIQPQSTVIKLSQQAQQAGKT